MFGSWWVFLPLSGGVALFIILLCYWYSYLFCGRKRSQCPTEQDEETDHPPPADNSHTVDGQGMEGKYIPKTYVFYSPEPEPIELLDMCACTDASGTGDTSNRNSNRPQPD